MGDALKKFITTDLIKFGLSRIFAKTEIPNMKGILNRIKYKLQEKFGGKWIMYWFWENGIKNW